MSEFEEHNKDPLTDKLGELESLLEQQESGNTADHADTKNDIPVLDELVTEDDYIEINEAQVTEQISETTNDIDDLAQKLEKKLSNELDEVLLLLKGKLKNSIMEELRTELDEQTEAKKEHEQDETNDNGLPG